jgi:hypothetical protein
LLLYSSIEHACPPWFDEEASYYGDSINSPPRVVSIACKGKFSMSCLICHGHHGILTLPPPSLLLYSSIEHACPPWFDGEVSYYGDSINSPTFYPYHRVQGQVQHVMIDASWTPWNTHFAPPLLLLYCSIEHACPPWFEFEGSSIHDFINSLTRVAAMAHKVSFVCHD